MIYKMLSQAINDIYQEAFIRALNRDESREFIFSVIEFSPLALVRNYADKTMNKELFNYCLSKNEIELNKEIANLAKRLYDELSAKALSEQLNVCDVAGVSVGERSSGSYLSRRRLGSILKANSVSINHDDIQFEFLHYCFEMNIELSSIRELKHYGILSLIRRNLSAEAPIELSIDLAISNIDIYIENLDFDEELNDFFHSLDGIMSFDEQHYWLKREHAYYLLIRPFVNEQLQIHKNRIRNELISYFKLMNEFKSSLNSKEFTRSAMNSLNEQSEFKSSLNSLEFQK